MENDHFMGTNKLLIRLYIRGENVLKTCGTLLDQRSVEDSRGVHALVEGYGEV